VMCTCKHVDGCTSYKETLPTRFHSGWIVNGKATFQIEDDVILAMLPLKMKLSPVIQEREDVPCAHCRMPFKPREARNLYCSNAECKRAQRRIKMQNQRNTKGKS
jgi:hypothetical protein